MPYKELTCCSRTYLFGECFGVIKFWRFIVGILYAGAVVIE